MSLAETPQLGGCAGCIARPTEPLRDGTAPSELRVDLALPGIHCAACIATVERGLSALPDVARARVNFGQKTVRIDGAATLTPEALIGHLAGLGIAAQALDTETLGGMRDAAGRALLMRTAVAGFAMMNVMLLSVAVWSGAADATRDLFHWISALIALPTVAFAGQPFFRNGWAALRAGRLNMDVPISLAILLASGLSLFETIAGGAHAYFDAALSLTFFLLVGRLLDHRTRVAARSAATQLSALEVPRVQRITPAGHETVALADVRVGDVVRVLPGARIPVDGCITHGRSDIDRALLTGESLPVARAPGDAVTAGEMNLSGPLTLRATAVGDDMVLRRMAALVELAETARNRYTALADRAARIYAPGVHLMAALAFAGWMIGTGDVRLSLNIAIAVLIITCPCALGLAVPAVTTAASGHLFSRGVLIKTATALERLAQVDTVVFDKTGTLTEGQLRMDALPTLTPAQRSIAAGLALSSDHPVARMVAAGLGVNTPVAALEHVTEHPGQGIEARHQGLPVRLGSADWVGDTVQQGPGCHLRVGEEAPIFLPLTGQLRAGAADAVARLRAQGYDIHLLSGDTPGATAPLARELRIEAAHAGLSPEQKRDYLACLADAGRHVLMVGDGLNDTAALSQAWASAAPAEAADAARAASDVVLLGGSLSALPGLLATARAARRRVIENFTIAAGYNAIAVPVALAGFASPLLAAIAMSSSSLLVLLNALRVRGGGNNEVQQ